MSTTYSYFKETTSDAINIFKPQTLIEYAACAIPCALAMVSSAGAMIASAGYLGYKWIGAQSSLAEKEVSLQSPSIAKGKSPTNFYIESAKVALVELVASAASMSLWLPFVKEGDLPFLIGTTLGFLAFSILLNSVRSTDPGFELTLITKVPLPYGESFSNRRLVEIGFSLISGVPSMPFMTLIHETGHILGNRVCYQEQAMGTLEIHSSGGRAFLNWRSYPSTYLGRILEKNLCRDFAIFSGPALELFAASVTLIAARRLKTLPTQEAKHFTNFLCGAANCSYLNVLCYALSALVEDSSKPTGHDFVNLGNAGIPPLAAAACILTLWIGSLRMSS